MKPINFWFQLHLLCSWIHYKKCHGDIFSQCNSQNSMISFDYSWFLGKNISKMLSPDLKLHNLYCHKVYMWFHAQLTQKILNVTNLVTLAIIIRAINSLLAFSQYYVQLYSYLYIDSQNWNNKVISWGFLLRQLILCKRQLFSHKFNCWL